MGKDSGCKKKRRIGGKVKRHRTKGAGPVERKVTLEEPSRPGKSTFTILKEIRQELRWRGK